VPFPCQSVTVVKLSHKTGGSWLTLWDMHVQICTGILAAFVLGLPYASEDLFSVHILRSDIGWWRVMLATAGLPALCQASLCVAVWFVYGWKGTFVTSPHPLLQVLCLLTVSESPTWLRHSGRPDDAHVAECKLFSGDDLNLALLDDVEEPSDLETQPQARLGTWHCGCAALEFLTAGPHLCLLWRAGLRRLG